MAPAVETSTRRRSLRLGAGVLLALLVVVVATTLFATWLVRTESGLRFAASAAARLTDGQIALDTPSGRLAGPLRIDVVRIRTHDLHVTIRDLALDWRPRALLFERHVDVASLEAGDIEFSSRPGEDEAAGGPPVSLELPVSLSVDALRVGRFAVREWAQVSAAGESPPVFELTGLCAALESDSARHRVENLGVTLPFGRLTFAGELDGGASPFPLTASGTLSGEQAARAYALDFRADGDLLRPHVVADVESDGVEGAVDLVASPFEPVPLQRLHATLGQIDPSRFAPHAPSAALRVEANLEAEAGDALVLSGPVTIVNREPGTWDAAALPVERVAARVRWTATATSADDLVIELPGDGTVRGSVAWKPADDGIGTVTAALRLAKIDPQRLDARLPATALTGSVDAQGDAARQTVNLDLRIGDGRVRANAELVAPEGETRRVAAKGELVRFDPRALFAAAPEASVSMTFEANASLAGPLALDAAWRLQRSTLGSRPLGGRGRVVVAGRRLADSDIDMTAGGNRVRAAGAWGREGDRLELDIDAPALAAFGTGFDGRARLAGTLSGTFEQPSGTFELFADALRLPGGLRVDGANAQGRFEAGLNGPVQLALGVSGVGRGEEEDLVDRAALSIAGRWGAHAIDLSATGLENDTLRARLEGGLASGDGGEADPLRLSGAVWQGRIVALETGGRFVTQLAAPAELTAAADRVVLGAATLAAGEQGRIRLDETRWTPELIAARGALSGLAFGLVRPAEGRARRGRGPLMLGAEWDIAAGESIEGNARVFRESGDLTVTGEIPARLALDHLEARAAADDNRLALSWEVRGPEVGELVGSATARVEQDPEARWRLAPDSALLGSARLSMPSIEWLGRLMQTETLTGGALSARFELAGTPAAPRASGSIDGTDLSIALVDQGLQLSGGELRAEFDRDRLRLVRLEFVSPNRTVPDDERVPVARLTREPGRLSASGEIALDSGEGRLRFDADRLPILQRPDRWLILSGGGGGRSTWTTLALDAQFRADAGYVELAEAAPPALSDDVVIVGREAPTGEGGLALAADVRVALGDHLYLSALGVDTRLIGELLLRVRGGEPMSAVGTISTAGGAFEGYGQNLTIERGRINFQGPLNNPGLNIVALRKGLAVEAGVEIVGTARRPVVRLVSQPNVPDPEKLSWLVLGRAPTSGAGADLGLLLPAAQALLGGPGGGMTDQLSRSLGLDQISIGQGELTRVTRSPTSRVVGEGATVTSPGTVSGQVLSLGKRLSSDLFLSFEQSLGGAENLARLTYQLSRRVSVVARGGSDNSADIHYTISFE